MLTVKNLYFSYPHQKNFQLENVSFQLEQGNIFTLVGPNGAGKTTLIKLILGILKPTKGSITYKNNLVLSYIPQKTDTHRLPITVNRFMQLSSRGKISQLNIDEALHKLKLDTLKKIDIKDLSGGQWQRVQLAHALLRKPDLLILDEPMQGVDLGAQKLFYQTLDEIKANCATLMVSHDLHLVMASTNKVICLNNHICCIGEPENLKKSKEFVELFGTSYLRPYHHQHDHNHV